MTNNSVNSNLEFNNKATKSRAFKSSPRLSLRLKATLAAIALGTLPVLAIGGFAYSVVDRQIRDNAIKEQETLTQTQGKRVSAFMFERYGDIQILANLGILTNSKLRKEVSPADKEKTLTKFVETYEVYDAIAAFDLNGDVIGQSSGVKEKNHKKANFFQEVLKTGKPTIFQPGLSKATGKITIIFAAPIIDKDTGKIIGVVRSKMPVKYIARVMGIEYDRAQESSEFQGKEVENHLIDANNKVFVASEETQNLDEEITKAIPGLAALKASHKLGSIEGFDASTPDPLLISYAPIEPYLSLPDLGWSVVVHQDKAIVFAASNRILTIIGIGTALSAAVISIIATIIANRAINPILEASKAVQKLGQGELKTRLTVRGTDELAILGVNINVMAEQLETSSEAQQRYTSKLMLQNDTLSNLARHEGVLQGNAKLAAKEFTETIARILQVARTSIWLYNPSRNGFVCFDSYEDKSKQHSEGLEFAAIDYPDYFQAIEQDRPIVAVDAHNNPATHEFSENYLKPLELTSKLDIPIRSAGMVGGVICCEQIGEQRNWDGDEIVFVSSIANLFSLTLENDRLQEEIIHLLDTVSEVEDGNFITRAKVSDRATGLVSDTFNRLLENLGQVLAQTLATARQVSSNAVELEQLSNK
ncbi:MAG: GAF domain-containing protein, partial [Xenococcaceae cyanobacterium]